MKVRGTGVLLRLPTDEELGALERARLGGDLDLDRSFAYTHDPGPPAADEVDVVAQAFVELADEAAHDIVEDLLGDLRIDGRDVPRWELLSAPRRIELAPELQARLAPLRRG
jgi:hypothetical protein